MKQDSLPLTKEEMREAFREYDATAAKLVRLSKFIKEAAPSYWKAQGYTVLPRLERLRENVFKEEK